MLIERKACLACFCFFYLNKYNNCCVRNRVSLLAEDAQYSKLALPNQKEVPVLFSLSMGMLSFSYLSPRLPNKLLNNPHLCACK